MKKIKYFYLTLVLLLVATTMPMNVFADQSMVGENVTSTKNNDEQIQTVKIDSDDFKLSAKEEKAFEEYSAEVIQEFKDSKNDFSADKIISKKAKEDAELVKDLDEASKDAISKAIDEENIDTNEKIDVELSSDFIDEYERTYKIDSNTEIIINPYSIIVSQDESLENNSESEVNILGDIINMYIPSTFAASKKSTGLKRHYKTGYNIFGLKLWRVYVECNFYYNKKQATYKSGYDG